MTIKHREYVNVMTIRGECIVKSMRLIGLAGILFWANSGVAASPECPCWDETQLNADVATLVAGDYTVVRCDKHRDGIPGGTPASVNTVLLLASDSAGIANAFASLRCSSPACNEIHTKCGIRNIPTASPYLIQQDIGVKAAVGCMNQIEALCRNLQTQ